MTVVVPLVGLAICVLAAFLYVMGHPSPREPVFIRRFRLHPSAIPEYIALLARGLFRTRKRPRVPLRFFRNSSTYR